MPAAVGAVKTHSRRQGPGNFQHSTFNIERPSAEPSYVRLDVECSRLNVGRCPFTGSPAPPKPTLDSLSYPAQTVTHANPVYRPPIQEREAPTSQQLGPSESPRGLVPPPLRRRDERRRTRDHQIGRAHV